MEEEGGSNGMVKRIRKIGDSLGIILPKLYLDALGIGENSAISIEVDGGTIVIKEAEVRKRLQKLNIKELVAQMRPEHNVGLLIEGEIGAEVLEPYSEEEIKKLLEKTDVEGVRDDSRKVNRQG